MMEAQKANVNFSNFDLSHVHKTSMDMGKLVPIACIPTGVITTDEIKNQVVEPKEPT